jgi:hypothetical protein
MILRQTESRSREPAAGGFILQAKHFAYDHRSSDPSSRSMIQPSSLSAIGIAPLNRARR